MVKKILLIIFMILSLSFNLYAIELDVDDDNFLDMGYMPLDEVWTFQKGIETITGGAKFFRCDGLGGATAGFLGSIPVANLVTGDMAVVVIESTDTMYFYVFNSTDTTATSSPYFIRPNDYSSAGVWNLLTGMVMGRSTSPTITLRDADATDADANYQLAINATDTGTGSEDIDIDEKIQIAGTPVSIRTVNADGNYTVGTATMPFSALGSVFLPEVYDDDIGAETALLIQADGQIGYNSSSERTKINIRDMENTKWLYDLQPKNYEKRKKDKNKNYLNEGTGIIEWGLIAEEVEKTRPELVSYNKDGKIRGVKYNNLIVPLLNEIKNLKTYIIYLGFGFCLNILLFLFLIFKRRK